MRKRGRKKKLSSLIPFLGDLVHIILLDTHPCLKGLLILGTPQKDIAKLLGIDYRTVSSYMAGNRKLPQKHLEPLLVMLNESLKEWKNILESEDIKKLKILIVERHNEEIFTDLDPEDQKRMMEIAYILVMGSIDLRLEYAHGTLKQETNKMAAKE